MKVKVRPVIRDIASDKALCEAELYRRRGADIGEGTRLYSVDFDERYPYLITVGKNCSLTHCTVLAHDGSLMGPLGVTRLARVKIGDDCFIGYGSMVMGGVRIGDRVIIGSGAVVTKDIPSDSVAVGVPARVIGSYSDYIEKSRRLLESKNAYISDAPYDKKSAQEKAKLISLLESGVPCFDR